jgi:hypothetical protein
MTIWFILTFELSFFNVTVKCTTLNRKCVAKILILTAIYRNFRVLWFTFQLSKKCQGQEHFNELMISCF